MTINTLKNICIVGALALGVSSCDWGNVNPDEKDIKQRTRLYSSWYHGDEPINENLEEGFIDPQKVIVEIRDQNGNQKREVVLNYEGIRYLMKKNNAGKIYLELNEKN